MQKKIFIGSLILLLGLVSVLGFVVADSPDKRWETEGINYRVATSIGYVDLPDGTFVGGGPSDFITLTKKRVLTTTRGDVKFARGTKVNCEHEPGEPDPCDAS